MLNIVVDENIPYADEYFSSFCKIKKLAGRTIKPEDLQGIDALIIRSVTKVNAELLSKADKLSFVGTCTIGNDHVDQDLLSNRGIHFASAPGCNRISVAEYVISALMVLSRRFNFNLRDKTLGIVGAGNTGSAVMSKALALGMKIKICDPFLAADKSDKRIFSSYDDVLTCDIVTFHVPLTKNGPYPTYHLLNKERLERISDDQIIINASRGDVVDNQALLDRMKRGSELRFVLDVWENEPKILPGLIEYAQIATPHIAGYSLEGKLNGTSIIARILAMLNGFDVDNLPDAEHILPPSDIVEVTVSGKSDESLIRKLIHLVYNVERDDGIFRQFYTDADSFDFMRKNYPVRREWSSLKIRGGDEVFKNLGFRVDE